MTTQNEPQRIIIPKTIRSSQRMLEQIEEREREKELRESNELGMLVRGVEKSPRIQREVILESPIDRSLSTLENLAAVERAKNIAIISKNVSMPIDARPINFDSPEDYMDEPEVNENKALEAKSGPTRFQKTLRGLGRASKDISRNVKRAATSEKTKEALRRTGRTAARVGGTTKGVVYVTGKRIEERTFDRPRSQKPLFRPLEASERRALGLPVPSVLSREELRDLALGVTPSSVARTKQRRVAEITNLITKMDSSLPSRDFLEMRRDTLNNEVRKWMDDPSPEAVTLTKEKREQLRLVSEALRDRFRINQEIELLEAERRDIERQDTRVPATIRAAAFSRAVKLSPGLGGVMPQGSARLSGNTRPVGSTKFPDETKRIRGQRRIPTEEELETDIVIKSLQDFN